MGKNSVGLLLGLCAAGALAYLAYRKSKEVRSPSAHKGWTYVWSPFGYKYWEHESGERAYDHAELGSDIANLKLRGLM